MQIELIPVGFPVSEIELIYKSKIKASERCTVKTSRDMYSIFLELWDKDKIDFIEQCKILIINRGSFVLGAFNVSSGGISGTVVDVRVAFTAALKMNASYIAICHNHPSGLLQPSRADEALTLLFSEAGKILDIRLIDHLIITKDGYYSFSDEGAL